jgi:hypothetical protein
MNQSSRLSSNVASSSQHSPPRHPRNHYPPSSPSRRPCADTWRPNYDNDRYTSRPYRPPNPYRGKNPRGRPGIPRSNSPRSAYYNNDADEPLPSRSVSALYPPPEPRSEPPAQYVPLPLSDSEEEEVEEIEEPTSAVGDAQRSYSPSAPVAQPVRLKFKPVIPKSRPNAPLDKEEGPLGSSAPLRSAPPEQPTPSPSVSLQQPAPDTSVTVDVKPDIR